MSDPDVTPPFVWFDFESEPGMTGDGSGDPETHYLTIANTDGDELAVICHRVCRGEYPIDGPLAEHKRAIAQHIVDALTHYGRPLPQYPPTDDTERSTDMASTTLIIDGVEMAIPMSCESDEDDTLRTTLDFSEAYNVLDAWQKANPDQRRFGFTGADDAGPESAYVAWTRNGVLEVVHVDPFYNGVDTMNSYAVDELTQVDGVEQA